MILFCPIALLVKMVPRFRSGTSQLLSLRNLFHPAWTSSSKFSPDCHPRPSITSAMRGEGDPGASAWQFRKHYPRSFDTNLAVTSWVPFPRTRYRSCSPGMTGEDRTTPDPCLSAPSCVVRAAAVAAEGYPAWHRRQPGGSARSGPDREAPAPWRGSRGPGGTPGTGPPRPGTPSQTEAGPIAWRDSRTFAARS